MAFDAPNFDLSEQELDGSAVVIRVSGEIHATTAPNFSALLNDAIARGKNRIVLDLTGVEFIDSTGLSVLLNGLRRVTRVRGAIVDRLHEPHGPAPLRDHQLDSTFEILPDCDEAIARAAVRPRRTEAPAARQRRAGTPGSRPCRPRAGRSPAARSSCGRPRPPSR